MFRDFSIDFCASVELGMSSVEIEVFKCLFNIEYQKAKTLAGL